MSSKLLHLSMVTNSILFWFWFWFNIRITQQMTGENKKNLIQQLLHFQFPNFYSISISISISFSLFSSLCAYFTQWFYLAFVELFHVKYPRYIIIDDVFFNNFFHFFLSQIWFFFFLLLSQLNNLIELFGALNASLNASVYKTSTLES